MVAGAPSRVIGLGRKVTCTLVLFGIEVLAVSARAPVLSSSTQSPPVTKTVVFSWMSAVGVSGWIESFVAPTGA